MSPALYSQINNAKFDIRTDSKSVNDMNFEFVTCEQ